VVWHLFLLQFVVHRSSQRSQQARYRKIKPRILFTSRGIGRAEGETEHAVDWPGRDAAFRLCRAGSALAKLILSTVYATKLHRKIIDNDLLLNASIDGTKVAL
jgi:hypothetical protein